MKLRTILAVLVFASLSVLQGCSIYMAATAPPPVALEKVKVGANRVTIVGTLGVPKLTENKADSRTDIYEFVDGSHSATKARILFYIAGDLFTLALSELVFWPIELGLGQGTDGRAVVTYGMDDIAKAVLLTKTNGDSWDATVTEPEQTEKTEISTQKVTPQQSAIIK